MEHEHYAFKENDRVVITDDFEDGNTWVGKTATVLIPEGVDFHFPEMVGIVMDDLPEHEFCTSYFYACMLELIK